MHLGMPIRGFGEDTGGRNRRHMHHRKYRKSQDPHEYTYCKFHVEGKKNDGVVHVEYADSELNYIIVEIPNTGNNFAIHDNRKDINEKVAQYRAEEEAAHARIAAEIAARPPAPVQQEALPSSTVSTVPMDRRRRTRVRRSSCHWT